MASDVKDQQDYWIFFHPKTGKEITESSSLEDAVESVQSIKSGVKKMEELTSTDRWERYDKETIRALHEKWFGSDSNERNRQDTGQGKRTLVE